MLLTWYMSLSPAQRLKTLLLVSSDAKEANSAGKLIYDGLRGVVAKMREVDRSWANQHLNCCVAFHSGWLTACQTVCVVETSATGMSFGDPSRRYRFVPYGRECLSALKVVHKTQVAFTMFGAPRDAVEWHACVTSATNVLKSLSEDTGALGDPTKYRCMWTMRAALEGERFIAKVARSFPVPSKFSIKRFAMLFPDQNEYLLRWSSYLQVKTVKALAKKIGYRGLPNHLTMFQCLLMDPTMRSLDLAKLKSKRMRTAILLARKRSRNANGHEGHPAVICSEAMAD